MLKNKSKIIRSKTITKTFFKGRWPFKFDKCKIYCFAGRSVYISVSENEHYALNGFAHDQLKLQFPFTNELMKSEVIDGEQMFYDLGKVINVGLNMFKGTKWSIL